MKICRACGSKHKSPDWRCPSCHASPETIDGIPAFAPEKSESTEGYDSENFEKLARLEESSFWFRSRNRLIIWALRKYFPEARSFLEIGCGTGFVLTGIEKDSPHLDVYGSDLSCEGLKHASRRLARARLFQMDALDVPFEEEFDVIGAFDVLEHVEEDEAVLRQMHLAARPGGGIILTAPLHPFLWSPADDFSRHIRRYAGRELRSKAEGAGFRVERATSFVSLLLPLLLLSRLMMRFHRGSIIDELSVGGISNALMEYILNIERGLIEFGANMPAGGSLLIVARK